LKPEFAICPSLFAPASAQDGILSRLRIPGGILTTRQCEAISQLTDQFADRSVQITNRANIQIRGMQTCLDSETLNNLQKLGLASSIESVDAIRNIMSSPTAGIDRQQLFDPRPLVREWNDYLIAHPDLAVLSPKFSVCFDGGESVSVIDRPNDLGLSAEQIDREIYLRLYLSTGDRGDAPHDVGVSIAPAQVLAVLVALTEVYWDYTCKNSHLNSQAKSRKPRLRELLAAHGVEAYLHDVENLLTFPLMRSPKSLENPNKNSYKHLGVHAQAQMGYSYIGIVIPLGRLDSTQFRGLGDLADRYGNGELRLTPWQNAIVPNIPNISLEIVQKGIENLGLSWSANHPYSSIVACSGITGCKSSATDTQAHAKSIALYLEQSLVIDRPINIHLSGCDRSCAQHQKSDIALLGVTVDGKEAYQIYVGEEIADVGSKFGRSLKLECSTESLPNLVAHMIEIYQSQRISNEQSFGEFANEFFNEMSIEALGKNVHA